jgi:hypothetical protein
MQFELFHVSIFYLLLITVFGYIGFKYAVKLGSLIGVTIGDALGSLIGALIAVFVSYGLFTYVRGQNMIKY